MRAPRLLVLAAAARAFQRPHRVPTPARPAAVPDASPAEYERVYAADCEVGAGLDERFYDFNRGLVDAVKGYDGIEALLKNWDKETFIKCGQAGQVALAAECDRDANKVPAALGLKSTDAPLFKVEKLFKAAITPDVDIDAWNLATEQFVQHSTSAQEYAYTASFGEYNPSGGKDQVAKYMDLSKDELVLARDALRDVLKQIGGL